jgi:integrase
LLDSGGRLGEISALTVEDIDFDTDVVQAVARDVDH